MIWFVCFYPKRPEHWWARKYGHVALAGYSDNTWVYIDLKSKDVEVRTVYQYDQVQDFLSYLLTYSTVLKFGPAKSERSNNFFRPMTCMTVIKHTLGIRSRALLPDALFRILQKEYDAEIVNESEPTGRVLGS